MLQITANVLIANPNPDNQQSTQDIQAILNSGMPLSVSCLVDAYYGRSEALVAVRGRQKEQLERIIEDVIGYNARVDVDELDSAAAHFDSEQFADGQQRLVEFREIITMEISRRNYASARRFAGRLLHTLQDFYSHSNWIELFESQGSSVSPNLALAERGRSVGNTAGPNQQTCTNCPRTGSLPLASLVGLVPFIESTSCYNCRNNIDGSLDARKILTTGYANGGRDAQNRPISKPIGKCSHGGVIDGTTDSPATGGINKDSTHDKLAPHYYLHQQAATTAQQHSFEFFSLVRNDVDDDELFGAFLGLELQVKRVVSLAMVFDTTQKTSDYLQEVAAAVNQVATDIQQYINTFENDLQVQYVLVPVNDSGPGVTFETNDISQLESAVTGLNIQSSGDGSIPTLQAILNAAEASQPDSSIFVLTDSSPSDSNLVGQVEAIIVQKNLRIIFVHINSRIARSLKKSRLNKLRIKRQDIVSMVYSELDVFSNGETISILQHEISELAAFVSFSTVQGSSTLIRTSGNAVDSTNYYFLVDSHTFQVLIFINSISIDVSVTTPQGTDASSLAQYSVSTDSSTLYIATINTTDPMLRGQWTITVTTSSSFSIQVLADSELTFLSEIIASRPNSTDDINELKPLVGSDISAELDVVGSTSPVTINTLDLINERGIIQSITDLVEMGNNTYISTFASPVEEFKLRINGMDDNGYNFTYISDISVEPATIGLTFGENDTGYLTLRPGAESNITTVLFNAGVAGTFRISINTDAVGNETDFFQYRLMPNMVTVSQDSTAEINVQVSFARNVPRGFSITFTLVAQLMTDFSVNNFITFDVVNVRAPSSAAGIMYTSLLAMKLLMTLPVLLMLHIVL